MHYITLTFAPIGQPIDGRFVTTRGLHGLLFNVLKQVNPAETDWLHQHEAPKPFSMVPLYDHDGSLVGLRYATMTGRATDLFLQGWQMMARTGQRLQLGRYQKFQVAQVESVPGPTFFQLAGVSPARQMRLRFLSPTAFKQGPGSLPLPLPTNVFHWPYCVWQTYAGAPLALPDEWPTWCAQEVFVVAHQIETAVTAVTQQEQFTGFVGDVTFRAHAGSDEELCIWQALGHLAAFCGVGWKTTMGMGAVEKSE